MLPSDAVERMPIPGFRTGPFLAAFALVAALVAVPRAARAQTPPTSGAGITVNNVVSRSTPSGSPPTHPQSVPTTGVTKADCQADVTLTFSLLLTGISASNHLEVWAGSGDCSATTARVGTTATCWPVIAGGITPSGSLQVPVRVQDMASQMSSPTKNLTYARAGADACNTQSSPGAVNLTISFMWIDGTNNFQGGGTKGVTIDMVGPPPPENVSVNDGDRVLVVNWSPPSSAGSDSTGFKVFCAPTTTGAVDSDAATDDGGSTSNTRYVCADGGFEDGGVDDAGNPIPGAPIDAGCVAINDNDASEVEGADAGCPAGVVADIPPLTECASAGGVTSNTATISDRTNNTLYTVAVASVDGYGNTGPLSQPGCATPGPVDDFFHRYRDDGGGAGGCALERSRVPVGAGVAGWLAGIVGFAAWRRRRRRARR